MDSHAAFAMVVWDDDGVMVMACSKLALVSSAYEAEMKYLDWAVNAAAKKPWRNLIFSSDALEVVNEVKSSREPLGWFSRDSIMCIRDIIFSKGWELCWETRNSNRFADFIAKQTLANNCNVLYSSLNLKCLPNDVIEIYVSDQI